MAISVVQPFELSEIEKEFVHSDLLEISVGQLAFRQPGRIMDNVAAMYGKQFVFKGIVTDHVHPTMTVSEILSKLKFKELQTQDYEVIRPGYLGVSASTHHGRYDPHFGRSWKTSDLFPSIASKIVESKYYLIKTLRKKESVKTLKQAQIPIFGPADDTLSKCMGYMAGVTFPYYYIGQEGTCFCWHKEDQLFGSVNYVISGYKIWYVIDPDHSGMMNDLCKTLKLKKFFHYTKKCTDGLNHRNVFISPATLRKAGIPFKIICQGPGEMLFLGSNVWHSGYNGTDCVAVALNCLASDWLEVEEKAFDVTCMDEGHGNVIKCEPPMLKKIRKEQKDRQLLHQNCHSGTRIHSHYLRNKDVAVGVSDVLLDDEMKKSSENQPPHTLGSETRAKRLRNGRFQKNYAAEFQKALLQMKTLLEGSDEQHLLDFVGQCATRSSIWKQLIDAENATGVYLRQRFQGDRQSFAKALEEMAVSSKVVAEYRMISSRKWKQ